ncbi:MAG: hypothetical protein EP305_03775 [Bacteroidetes bacterium]|nr:MAG: hypothetical protein EP305_03775 [Bacteroidota bacterium]
MKTIILSIGICMGYAISYGQQTEIRPNAEIKHLTCFNTHDGEIHLRPQGGTEPYTVQWNDGAQGLVRTNLEAGKYVATIQDASANIREIEVKVDAPEEVKINLDIKHSDSWYSPNGSIVATTNGQEIWISKQLNQLQKIDGNADKLSEGIYIVSSIDENNCMNQVIANVELHQRTIDVDLSQFNNGPRTRTSADASRSKPAIAAVEK